MISQSAILIGETLKKSGKRFIMAICPKKIAVAIPMNPLQPLSRQADCPVLNARALNRFQNWNITKRVKILPLPPLCTYSDVINIGLLNVERKPKGDGNY